LISGAIRNRPHEPWFVLPGLHPDGIEAGFPLAAKETRRFVVQPAAALAAASPPQLAPRYGLTAETAA